MLHQMEIVQGTVLVFQDVFQSGQLPNCLRVKIREKRKKGEKKDGIGVKSAVYWIFPLLGNAERYNKLCIIQERFTQ